VEYLVQDIDGFKRRKYSNETMRGLRIYVNAKGIKLATEGYSETLDRMEVFLNNKRLRTEEEILEDRECDLWLL